MSVAEALERADMAKERRKVNAISLLMNSKQKQVTPLKMEPVEGANETVQDNDPLVQEPLHTNAINDRKSKSPLSLLKNGRFNFSPQRRSLIVKFPVDSDKLVHIVKNSNEKVKINRHKWVTLKIPREKFALALKIKLEPLKPKVKASASSHPFFQAVKRRMESATINKMKIEEKQLKDKSLLVMVNLKRDQFSYKNINAEESKDLKQLYERVIHLNLKRKQSLNDLADSSFNTQLAAVGLDYKKDKMLNFDPMEFMLFYSTYVDSQQIKSERKYSTKYLSNETKTSLISNRYKNSKDSRYKRFFSNNQYSVSTSDQWCDCYRPMKGSQVLQTPSVTKALSRWIDDAFSKLVRVDQHRRKEILKKAKKKSNNFNNNSIKDFIAYDFDDNETEDDTFVPSLIIEGPQGCGKTSIVHSIIKEHKNGHVFELNNSQSRAKKDIEFHLKQIGTTSMVKNEQNTENTIILFDDVELIDEEDIDKDFWIGVTELLTYSYRPIIFTTNDLSKIPHNIVEESTVYKFGDPTISTKAEYLDLLAIDRNLVIAPTIINELAKFDIRRSIMELQMFSYKFNKPEQFLEISERSVTPSDINSDNTNSDNTSEKEHSRVGTVNNKKLLTRHLTKLDIEYFNNPHDEINFKSVSRFENDIWNCLEFYSSKLISFNSSRRERGCRYEGPQEYLLDNPSSSFQRLPRAELATDIVPLIKTIAKEETMRVTRREEFEEIYQRSKSVYLRDSHPVIPERKFASDPCDVFDDLF